jgi:hypothetical protein
VVAGGGAEGGRWWPEMGQKGDSGRSGGREKVDLGVGGLGQRESAVGAVLVGACAERHVRWGGAVEAWICGGRWRTTLLRYCYLRTVAHQI